MKRLGLLFAVAGLILPGAELSAVHTVYLLPMGGGLDQYLANRLTSEHVFQVVTDAKLADAVFTDRIGNAFEERLVDLTAPPPKEKQAASQPAANPPAANPNTASTNQIPPVSALPAEAVNRLSNPAANSTFGHGKGTIFLVDIKTKQVLWSVYEQPKSVTSNQLDRSASEIVNRLKRELNKPEGNKP
ncbi:MAG: hypothetical protein JO336_04285 [Acidobacteriia bacterium]|nr:hypothetical protein [Terriglobia bacterium]MBV8903119.1 hypothetical protein [Terriglobia bacterium]